jgi:tetratricopeptide (TPR) repeat protein
MNNKGHILIYFLLFLAPIASGQCPDRKFLLKRINYLRDSTKVSTHDQLAILLPYVDSVNKCHYKNDSIHAQLFRRIGALYYEQTDYIKALEYYQEYVHIAAENADKPSMNIRNLPGGYYWLSVIYDSLRMLNEKWKALDNCASMAERIGTIDRSNLYALYSRMIYFIDIGDYYRCIDYAKRCETLGRNYARENIEEEHTTGLEYMLASSLVRAQVLLTTGDYNGAEKILFNKIDECKRVSSIGYLGIIYEQLANLQRQKGNYEKAHQFLKSALRSYEEEKSAVGYKRVLKIIGADIYYRFFRNYDSALLCFKRALKIRNKDQALAYEDAFESLSILSSIANVYVQKGIFDSAWHYFQLASSRVGPGMNESAMIHGTPEDYLKQEKIYYRTNLLMYKANAYRQLYRREKEATAISTALQIYKLADHLLDSIKTFLTEYQSKLYWRKFSKELYENAIEACYLNGDATSAFYFFEKSRAVLLYDQLNEHRWLGEKDILRQTELQRKILQTERELVGTDRNSKKYDGLQRELFLKKHELDLLRREIKNSNPLYYQNFLDTGFITVDQVKQKVMHDHQVLIELFSGDSAVYFFAITPLQSVLRKIDKAEFDRLSLDYNRYLTNAGLLNSNFDGYVKTARGLYRLIFQSLLIEPGRVIISPDGQYFPFEALITSQDGRALAWFLNDHPVSYTYSARFLMNDFSSGSAKKGEGNFMGIAPVNFPSAFSLAALPGSGRSLDELQSYFRHSNNLINSAASRKNFLNQYHRYRIIQLYTHSSDSSDQGEPVIYFADSALYLSDLIGDNRPITRLIILSACETGVGKIYQGEGVFSFSRGFAALGIPAAMTNLWSVNNESTYKLTELFYKWLAKGLAVDVALQKAKLEFLQTSSKEKSLPCYWAAPILVGQAAPIEWEQRRSWKWVASLTGIGILLLLLFGKWLVSNKRFRKPDRNLSQKSRTKQLGVS